MRSGWYNQGVDDAEAGVPSRPPDGFKGSSVYAQEYKEGYRDGSNGKTTKTIIRARAL